MTEFYNTEQVSYIVGRMNPPHAGHIHLIREMIRQSPDARHLILLGDGPVKKSINDEMDNPLDFNTKKEIIINKLNELNIPQDVYTIMQKQNPAGDVMKFVGFVSPETPIKITYFVGNKEAKNTSEKKGDADKMLWLNNFLLVRYNQLRPNIDDAYPKNIIEHVVIQPMQNDDKSISSGTHVRKSVYEIYSNHHDDEDKGYRMWENKYPTICQFYQPNSREIYDKILEHILSLQKDEQLLGIHYYLHPEKTKAKSSASATKKKREQSKTKETKETKPNATIKKRRKTQSPEKELEEQTENAETNSVPRKKSLKRSLKGGYKKYKKTRKFVSK